MSSAQQIWLAVIVTIGALFVGTATVSTLSTKQTLEQQLNRDSAANASVIAYFLQSTTKGDATLQLQLPPKFDASAYPLIQLADFTGTITALRQDRTIQRSSPQWFDTLFPIETVAGVASIVRGDRELGAITIESDTASAYGTLWEDMWRLAILFALALVAIGSLGNRLLSKLLRPLDAMTAQAEALTRNQMQLMEEPATAEFKTAARALNKLSKHNSKLISQQATLSRQATRERTIDPVTGLLNRDQFLTEMKTELKRQTGDGSGALCIIRFDPLYECNKRYGWHATDYLLAAMGHSLNSLCRQKGNWVAGRLNGSDFALLAARAASPLQVAFEAQAALQNILVSRNFAEDINLPGAATVVYREEPLKDTFTRLDSALSAAISNKGSDIYVAGMGEIMVMPVREQLAQWRDIFRHAFSQLNFSLAAFPVAGLEGELLHVEAPARLSWQQQEMTASQFLPWIYRLELARDLDQQVIELALQKIESDGQPICINLSANALSDPAFLLWISNTLDTHAKAAPMLWLEAEESAAFVHLQKFSVLSARVRAYGAKVGIEHAGHRLADIGRLEDVELDYLKIDAAFIRDIDQNRANQTIVRTLCALSKTTGVMAIAQGVNNEGEWNILKALGIDGVTGPGVTLRGDNNPVQTAAHEVSDTTD